mgnify:CR=1 FL=1
MTRLLNDDFLLPADPGTRAIARRLYDSIADLPIVSPHGHTDPAWFANDTPFSDPAELLITPDHYVFRMLYSAGVRLEDLGIAPQDGSDFERDPRAIWHTFAKHYHLFAGTPSRIWHDWVYDRIFGLTKPLSSDSADHYFDVIAEKLASPEFAPRALMNAFKIETIATTEQPLDPLIHHAKLIKDGWGKRVVTTFRPDNVTDPDYEGFAENLAALSDITGIAVESYDGYLKALRDRRAFFKQHGATASDHSYPTAQTADLSEEDAAALYLRIRTGGAAPQDKALFRAQMLTEMARMSVEDGLVMQVHCGPLRNHNAPLFERFGRDKGADIPDRMEYTHALQPLLNRFGNDPRFSMIIFTLDESVYARELAPLAGHYPALKLGPPWWFHDSPEGMRRFRAQTTETAGFYNTVGFNDDTRAFLSIPARHDVARRMDSGFLAELVADHRLREDEAMQIAQDLTYNLVKQAYRF